MPFPKKKNTREKRRLCRRPPRNNNTESLLLAVLFSRSARAEKKDETKMFKNLSLFLGISFFFVPLGFRVKKEKVPSVFFPFFFALRKRHFFRTGYFFPLLMSTSSSSLTSPLSSLERRRWSSSLGKQQRCATTRVSRPLFFFSSRKSVFFSFAFWSATLMKKDVFSLFWI